MKDRVVQYPNRYKLTQVSGDVYDLTPEPGIVTEPGTDLNKANLLKDDTAALYGLGADAVPDDVFAELAYSPNKIGDIKITARTDLGDDWLLCNGALLDAEAYPDLAAVIGSPKPEGAWSQNPQGGSNLLGITYGNGYWVAVGSSGTLYYKADTPVGAWAANSQGSTHLYGVTYSNGYWVAVGNGGTLLYKVKTLPTITLDGAYAYIRAK